MSTQAAGRDCPAHSDAVLCRATAGVKPVRRSRRDAQSPQAGASQAPGFKASPTPPGGLRSFSPGGAPERPEGTRSMIVPQPVQYADALSVAHLPHARAALREAMSLGGTPAAVFVIELRDPTGATLAEPTLLSSRARSDKSRTGFWSRSLVSRKRSDCWRRRNTGTLASAVDSSSSRSSAASSL
jgi:hypothetical protein